MGHFARLLACAALIAAVPGTAQETPQGGAPKSLLPPVDQAPTSGAPKPLLPELQAPPPAAVVVVPAEPVAAAPVAPPRTPAPPAAETEKPHDPLGELAGPAGTPDDAGLLTPATGGYDAGFFNGSDGRLLATLLERIEGPLASRWAQIMVQRALLSRAAPPVNINPGDWLAARGEALVRMGSAADAHRMIGDVAIDRYTPGLYAAAADASLAAADPVGLCPLSVTAYALTASEMWALADGMCSAILGDDYGASVRFDRVRARNDENAFDAGLAERIASAVGGGRSGANPAWDEVPSLSPWRVGLASAAGLAIPDTLISAAKPAERAWMTRIPRVPIETRARLAPEAAALGVLSSAEVNRIMALSVAGMAPADSGRQPGGELRQAASADSVDDRVSALKSLWRHGADGSAERYGWLVASATPAARLPLDKDAAESADSIAAALVSAGLNAQAVRWWDIAAAARPDVRAGAWAAVVAADAAVPMDEDLYAGWAKKVPKHRAELLAAGLEGLGRGRIGPEIAPLDNAWTRAIVRAASEKRAGEVMILAASGLQGGWNNVHADYLRRIAAALIAVGLESEARMIVAEAAIRG